MYCINCGVKLADTEKQCPLCNTTVYHPDLKREEGAPLYPSKKVPAPEVRSRLWMIIITVLFFLPCPTLLLCDLQINKEWTWAGYAIGALALIYELLVLPFWFKRPNPVIFVPCGFAAVGAYLWYINFATAGNWFIRFALPMTAGFCLITTAVVALTRYLKKGRLYVCGGAFMALGGMMLLAEFLLNITFGNIHFIGWSFHPLIALFLLGGLLIFLAICRPARETMERKFFI